MKYDDAEYYFLNFERDLDNEAAGTHLGMYLAWAILRGLGSAEYDEPSGVKDQLQQRTTTGQTVLFDHCDGKLYSDDFNELGNAFTQAYYEKYFSKDFARAFQRDLPDTGCPVADTCSLPDTWANFDRMAAVLDQRFKQWQEVRQRHGSNSAGASPKPPAPASTAAAAAPTTAGTSKLSLVPMDHEATDQPSPPAPTGVAASGFDLAALKRRAEAGDAEAWVEIGGEFIIGERVPRDFPTAAAAFQKGADLGSENAMFNLGVCYQNGDGVPKDVTKALAWFARAADRGHAQGLFMLGMAYRNGAGVTKDLAASNALMVIAHAKGVAEAGRQGVIAGAGSYAELGKRLSTPGQVLSTMAERHGSAPGYTPVSTVGPGSISGNAMAHRTNDVGKGTATPNTAAAARSGSSFGTNPDRSNSTPDFIGLGLTAAGASSVFVLLLFATMLSGSPFRFIAYTLAWLGAFGVFRLLGQPGRSMVIRVLLTLAALVPVAGSFVCIYALMLYFRKPNED
ncbi:tetratricopeptide repeat protein [Ahniella affigens]|nr:tetratricopeptide repeat protein [Ahniella affigens]